MEYDVKTRLLNHRSVSTSSGIEHVKLELAVFADQDYEKAYS